MIGFQEKEEEAYSRGGVGLVQMNAGRMGSRGMSDCLKPDHPCPFLAVSRSDRAECQSA